METIVLILTCIANLALGALIYLRNPKLISSRAFMLMSVFISLWAVTNYLTNLVDLHNLLLTNIFNRAAFVTSYLAIVSGLIFTFHFPRRRPVSRLERQILTASAVLTLFLACMHYVSGVATYEGRELHFSTGPYVSLYIGSVLICLLLMIRNLTVILRSNENTLAATLAKSQARVVLTGTVVTIPLALAVNVIIPSIFESWHITNYGPVFTIILVASFSYAIVKHKLFDIRSVIFRSMTYTLTTVVLGALYIAPMLYVLGTVIMGYPFVWSKFLIGVAVGTFAATQYATLRRWFDGLTKKIFFRDAYDSAALLGKLNRTLVATTDLHKMLYESADLIATNLKADFCVFALKSKSASSYRIMSRSEKKFSEEIIKKASNQIAAMGVKLVVTDYIDPEFQELKDILDRENTAIIIGLSADGEPEGAIGYLLLGYKKSGNPYNAQDVETLDTIGDVLFIAIQNALHYEEIQNFNITLQQKVEDATRQLRRTNAKLEALDETKDDFISMASHQLRTPLTSVKGYLSMVLEGDAGKVTPMQRKMLDQAFVSSQRMVFLIADLLNISRLKTGKFVIEPSKVSLAKIVADEVRQLQETAKSRSLELHYDKPADFPILMLDETKIRQVIMNFIDNAIYYTTPGGTVQVKLSETSSTIELRVTDTGIGVPRAEQPHLFTKFYRAGNARRARPDGTGLGLFMAKKVVVAQGGAVIFESKEGKGSTFGFIFSKQKLALPEPMPKKTVTGVV